MRHLAFGLFIISVGVSFPWSAAGQAPPGPALAGKTVVFIANGIGDSTVVSDNLQEVVSRCPAPLALRTVYWCRYGILWEDYADRHGQRAGGDLLARYALAVRQTCPGSRVVFVGHSAGTQVVLDAAERLPPGSVDRIILLAATVSCRYNLSAALRASCGGIDSFWSPEDSVLPGTVEFGTTDGQLTEAAGRVGFATPPGADPGVYCNLRQHRWHDGIRGQGDHFVWTTQFNLRDYVVPLLLSAP